MTSELSQIPRYTVGLDAKGNPAILDEGNDAVYAFGAPDDPRYPIPGPSYGDLLDVAEKLNAGVPNPFSGYSHEWDATGDEFAAVPPEHLRRP